MRILLLAVFTFLAACTPFRQRELVLTGFAPSGAFSERTRVMQLAPGVTATIVAPERLDRSKRIDLILYALPNGNTTAQTMGRAMTPGLDWHFDIQHIAAQTRAIRTMGMAQAVVVYLEADTKSWPAWRQRMGYPVANKRIVAIVDSLRAVIGGAPERVPVILSGHSGGGSFMFGFIEGQDAIPDWIERIVFLDANYNFAAEHGPKLEQWIRRSPDHTLVVMAYDDREIMLDGKKVVSDSGGTWRATERMMRYLRPRFTIGTDSVAGFIRHNGEQFEILTHPNPQNRILHTEMIGEMNGFMHAVLTRRHLYSYRGDALGPKRAYTQWVDPPPDR
jgi:hypothetical protein